MNAGAAPTSVSGRRSRRRRSLIFGAALAVASLVLAACGGGSSNAPASTGPAADVAAAKTASEKYLTAPTQITQTTALSKPAPTGKKIIFANSGLPATQLIQGGAKEAAEALGWSFETVTYDNANPSTLQAALQTALAKKPDAVIIAGNAPATYGAGTLDAYKAAGVPLIVGSVCPLTVVDPLVAGMAGCEVEEAAGKAFANWFIADSNGTGHALFVNVKAIPSLAAFVNAFSGEVGSKCSGCKVDVLEATLGQVADNQLVPAAVNKLRTDASYNYLFFDNAQFAKGIGTALKAAALDEKVKVGGRSMDEAALTALQQGTQAAWTALAYNVLGYGNVDSAVRKLVGQTDQKPVVPPFQLVTPDNAKDLKAPYRLPADALAQYKKIWGQ